LGAGSGHVEREEAARTSGFGQASMDRLDVTPEGKHEAVPPVGLGVRNVLDLHIRAKREKEGHGAVGVVSDNRFPQADDTRLERFRRRTREFMGLR
jgi:hypothetical protein